MTAETEALVQRCLVCQCRTPAPVAITYLRTNGTWPLQAGVCPNCTGRVRDFDRIGGPPQPQPQEGNG